MRAEKVNPDLKKYANSPIALAQVARAKAFLEKHPVPPHLLERSESKRQTAELCNTLKDERNRQHLTQSQLAERVGMHKEFISRIENGHVDVQLSTFLKVAEGLGLKMSIA
ncbi:MAG: XRE family transcriptional regulator [Cytophagia bacterium]|jgi:HTH-type transcriptional regulator / antitoxin HipB|nr:MAG: XRE family transcriptional regulator [Cytophagales bacterium]TAG38445.1 MAG: XRE family transcriptional regulator [Cytophagia bacterium]TAG53578.1 MAG: XRE family transcriptional regulator [Runella slithyformis]TAG67609.1 MAG: XRE family transcriptional regulator [Runella slithyformis]TAG80024.1 MAG: XRE family transcriptional regulator [Cytophagales bacterium]